MERRLFFPNCNRDFNKTNSTARFSHYNAGRNFFFHRYFHSVQRKLLQLCLPNFNARKVTYFDDATLGLCKAFGILCFIPFYQEVFNKWSFASHLLLSRRFTLAFEFWYLILVINNKLSIATDSPYEILSHWP